MNENNNFYKFIHKQILVLIALFVGTSPGYIFTGYLYSSMLYEFIWFILVLVISSFGYTLYRNYDDAMTIEAKDTWLNKARAFMFVYFSLWTVMFAFYVQQDNPEMHYIAIATQLGGTVVAATILASQKKLVISTVITMMLPITVYFLYLGEMYSYLLALFTVVLSGVLLYAAKNTHDYLVKSNYQAYHDHLTTLGNRRYFLEILDSSVKQYGDKYTYLLLVDLDYFKTINDTLGHDIGDELLKEVARRMKTLSKYHSNKIARLGGDEFCILSSAFENEQECLQTAEIFSEDLLREIKKNYVIDGNHLYISASVGVSLINSKHVQANEFLKEADMAMYEAKHNGRDGVIVFNDELCKLVQKKLEIERMLHFAIEHKEIHLMYQPQVDSDGRTVGCEVLVRWENEKLGFISPEVFIPMAEGTGYIIELGEYILEESLKTIREWSEKSVPIEQISINISMRQLLNQDFTNTVDRLFKKYDIESLNIEIIFEITETSTSDDLKNLVEIINELKKFKISFSMDDFGTGYSSLSYLREIPISELKIDQSFVSQISDEKQAALVKTIIEIAKNLKLTIVAEGVEDEYQRAYLKSLDCNLFQGYLFSKPLLKEEFENYTMQKMFQPSYFI